MTVLDAVQAQSQKAWASMCLHEEYSFSPWWWRHLAFYEAVFNKIPYFLRSSTGILKVTRLYTHTHQLAVMPPSIKLQPVVQAGIVIRRGRNVCGFWRAEAGIVINGADIVPRSALSHVLSGTMSAATFQQQWMQRVKKMEGLLGQWREVFFFWWEGRGLMGFVGLLFIFATSFILRIVQLPAGNLVSEEFKVEKKVTCLPGNIQA